MFSIFVYCLLEMKLCGKKEFILSSEGAEPIFTHSDRYEVRYSLERYYWKYRFEQLKTLQQITKKGVDIDS